MSRPILAGAINQDNEQRLALVEHLHWSAELDLERLLEMGEITRVANIIENIQERMPKPREVA